MHAGAVDQQLHPDRGQIVFHTAPVRIIGPAHLPGNEAQLDQ
jgi:hypothetical protein